MATWYTADLHFGHENIIRHCNRPFPDADAMDAALVERWNEAVAPADTVWLLGDVALSTKKLGLVAHLRGHKILVAGNHDSCWEGHKRWRRATRAYTDAGFEKVLTSGQLKGWPLGRLGNGPQANLSHLPYRGDSHDEDRYADRRPDDDGLPLLCGHVHERWKISGRQINVGVDVWDYRPVAEATLYKLIDGLPPAGGGAE